MHDLKTFRREWSSDQKELRMLLKSRTDLDQARELFLAQHAVLHRCSVSGMDSWSYADEIFSGLSEDEFRIIPKNEDHSLIWILWHISRIEDVTMNVLVAGDRQIYIQDQWKRNLNSPIDHVGNEASPEDLINLSRDVDIHILLNYRDEVGEQTRHIVSGLGFDDLGQKVQPDRLDRLIVEGAVLPEAEGLLAYWGKRKIYELLLMPPTRHLMTHMNEAYSLLKKIIN